MPSFKLNPSARLQKNSPSAAAASQVQLHSTADEGGGLDNTIGSLCRDFVQHYPSGTAEGRRRLRELLRAANVLEDSEGSSRPRSGAMERIASIVTLSGGSSKSRRWLDPVAERRCAAMVPAMLLLNRPKDFTAAELDEGDAALSVFQPWQGSAVLAFVDISGYSKATTALAPLGPHVLSEVINDYFNKIIYVVVRQYDGDVVKFAGDAMLVAWVPAHEDDAAACALRAVACCLQLQAMCGAYHVPLVDGISFSLHIGIVFGTLETDVFFSEKNDTFLNQQQQQQPVKASSWRSERGCHSASGPAIREIGAVTDAAASGEICVTSSLRRLIVFGRATASSSLIFEAVGSELTEVPIEEDNCIFRVSCSDFKAFNKLERSLSPLLAASPSQALELSGNRGCAAKTDEEEEDAVEALLWFRTVAPMLVHPSLVSRFDSGDADVMAEMRFLAVLFIAKTDVDAPVDEWFREVRAVLDAHHCAMVKLIDDDKGVHVIAAAGLYVSEPDASQCAVEAAHELASREACVIGVASGLTFCGMIGTTDVASRWDVTGASCVRSCRLMQYAHQQHMSCVVDSSTVASMANRALVADVPAEIYVKGTHAPVTVYGLSETRKRVVGPSARTGQAAWLVDRPPPNMSPRCHASVRDEVCKFLQAAKRQATVVIRGPPGVGKRCLCHAVAQRLQYSVIAVRASAEADPFYTVAGALTSWFLHHAEASIRAVAEQLDDALQCRHDLRARRLLAKLLQTSVSLRLRTMVVVRSAQDCSEGAGLRFLCRSFLETPLSNRGQGGGCAGGYDEAVGDDDDDGAIALMMCETLGSATTPDGDDENNGDAISSSLSSLGTFVKATIADEACRSRVVTVVELQPVDAETCCDIAARTFSWNVAVSLQMPLIAYTGGIPALVFAFVRHVMAQRPYVSTMSSDATVHLLPEAVPTLAKWSWVHITPVMLPRLLLPVDLLSDSQRLLLRIVACLEVPYAERYTSAPTMDEDDGGAPWYLVVSLHQTMLSRNRRGAAQIATCARGLLQRGLLDTSHRVLQGRCRCCPTLPVTPHDDEALWRVPTAVRVCNPALRDVILQTLTPDYIRLILAAAQNIVLSQPSPSSGTDTPHCGNWAALRHAQYRCISVRWETGSSCAPSFLAACVEEAQRKQREQADNFDDSSLSCVFHAEHLARLHPYLANPDDLVVESSRQLDDTISLAVVHVKNYMPRIHTGFSIGRTICELTMWLKTAYMKAAARIAPPPSSGGTAGGGAANRGLEVVSNLGVCWERLCRCVAPVLPTGCDTAHRYDKAAVDDDLRNIVSVVERMEKLSHERGGAKRAASCCEDFLRFLRERVEPLAAAIDALPPDTVLALLQRAAAAATLSPPTSPLKKVTSLGGPTEHWSSRPSVGALYSSLRIFSAALSSPSRKNTGRANNLVQIAAKCFHASFMSLATDEVFAAEFCSEQFSLAFIRDRVLHERTETPYSFMLCAICEALMLAD